MHEKLAERWNALSLRTKMTGVSVLLLTLGLIVAGAGSATVLRNYLTEQVDARVNLQLAALDFKKVFVVADGACQVNTTPTDYFVALYSDEGPLLCDNDPAVGEPRLTTVAFPDDGAPTVAFTAPGAKNIPWRAVSVAAVDGDGEYYTIVVAYSLAETDGFVARFTAIFLFFALTVVVLGGALTRLLVSSTFSPLREVEATAARFAAGDFSQRLSDVTPNTEVGRLNQSLNAMMGRIDGLFADRAKTIDQMRRFVGDASHELRTPLVSVRGYAELYRMGALPTEEAVAQAMERIEKEAIRMGLLVEDLLELARIDESKPLQLAEVDLVALARDAALDAMASSPGRTVSVVVTDVAPSESEDVEITPEDAPDAPPGTAATGPIRFAGTAIARLRARRTKPLSINPSVISIPQNVPQSTKVVVTAEENKIRQVVTNLMGNAMRFTPDDSPIEIGIERDPGADLVSVSVIDHGEGIPEQIRDKIFQRFWRADTSRTRDTGGSGLGLAIVASIVAAHKGTIDVVETPGGGATFRVTLPVLPIPAIASEITPESAD